MAPNVYPALVVRLQAPDPRIKALDFTTAPGPVCPNCGIKVFKHYAFDRVDLFVRSECWGNVFLGASV